MEQERPNNIDKQQMSEEELQRTQVLNLDDFRNVARIEKIGSKKPAIIVGIVGTFLILLGTTVPAIQSYNARKKAEESHVIAARKKEDVKKPVETTLVCTGDFSNLHEGLNEKIKSTYMFEDGELKTLEKEFEFTKKVPKSNVAFFDWFKGVIPEYMVQVSGYSLTIKDVENGLINTTKVDYDELDITKVPEFNKTNFRFDTEFEKDATEEEVKKDRISKGYECK